MKKQKKFNLCKIISPCQYCKSNDFCKEWVNFIDRHGYPKCYAHFDERKSLSLPSVRDYVQDKSKIVSHSFYPFIHFQRKNSRYGKKGRKKSRHLYYCSHLDRCVYQRYAFLINYQYNVWAKENDMDDVAIAYRDNLGKDNIDFAQFAIDTIRKTNACFIMVGDFTDFFDGLNHQYLKKMLCKLLKQSYLPPDYYAVFKNITKFSSWDWKEIVRASGESITERGVRKKINQKRTILTREQFDKNKHYIKRNDTGVGIPQGSPISAVLANVYMIEFDSFIKKYVEENSGIYMRYSDDFILIFPEDDVVAIEKHKRFIASYMKTMKGLVELQSEKTHFYIYKNSKILSYPSLEPSVIDYLGFCFDGQKIKIRPKSVTKYYYRMRRKAKTVGRCNGISSKGKYIFPRNLYNTYALNKEKQTFISYAIKANRKLSLQDAEINSLIKNHKKKIAMAIKAAKRGK